MTAPSRDWVEMHLLCERIMSSDIIHELNPRRRRLPIHSKERGVFSLTVIDPQQT